MQSLSLRSFVLIFVLAVAIVGCEKDKDEKENSFSYDSNSYDTPKGYIDVYGANEDNQSADFDVILCSSSISYNSTEEEYTGSGNVVYIDLNSSSLTELVSGTYTYDETRNPNTFVDAGIYIDYDLATYTGTEYYYDENTTGTVTINKSGSTYEISYNFTLETGKNVEGYYKGTLETAYVSDHATKKSTKVDKYTVKTFKGKR